MNSFGYIENIDHLLLGSHKKTIHKLDGLEVTGKAKYFELGSKSKFIFGNFEVLN